MPQRAWEFKIRCSEEQWTIVCEQICANVPRAAAYYNLGRIHGFLLDYDDTDYSMVPAYIGQFTEWHDDVMDLADLYFHATYVIQLCDIVQVAKVG